MKILHVNTYPFGGAFTGAYRLHEALLKEKIDSKMLVSTIPVNPGLKEVYVYNRTLRTPNFFNRALAKFGYPRTADQKRKFNTKGLKGEYEIISYPFSDIDITKSDEYNEADIIQLHWIAGFVNYKNFFKKCKKPVVFTLRDLNPMQGIFHYEGDKNLNLAFSTLEKKYLNVKISSLSSFKEQLKVVGISEWITEKSKCSIIFKDFKHYTIHNCINVENYKLIDKKKAKGDISITDESIVFSFVSDITFNKRKGLDLLLQAFTNLPKSDNIIILTVGKGDSVKFPIDIIHKHLGPCNQSELSTIFCASDAFIFPTREEALGNVMLEAMACGTPVIGTPVGGLLDVIQPGFNGILSKDVSAEGLKDAIVEFINTRGKFNSAAIRSYVEENFNEELIAGKYIKLYKSILERD